MNNVIAVRLSKIGNDTVQTVNARDIHDFLMVGKDFSTWIKKQIERARLVENRDYIKLPQKGELSATGQICLEYHLSMDAGKHIAMLSGTEKGFIVREYFIECEKKVNSNHFAIPSTFPEALRLAAELAEKNNLLECKIEEEKPLVSFAKQVEASVNSMTFSECAKAWRKEGLDIGQHRLTDWLRRSGYLMKNNSPYQRYLSAGYFEVTEKAYYRRKSESHTYAQTLITGKGQIAILDHLKRCYPDVEKHRRIMVRTEKTANA